MIAMAEAPHKTRSTQEELDLFIEQELPPHQKHFPVWWLAKFWHTSINHICRLIELDDLECPLDLRTTGSSRAEMRVPRPCVLAFIRKRRDVKAIAEANPSVRWNEKSRRKARRA